MLTIRQAQQRTNLAPLTIRRYVTSGTIHAELKNGKYYIPESELAKLPKPRERQPLKQAEKVEFPYQDAPFPLERYQAETERLKEENRQEKLRQAQSLAQLIIAI